VASSPHDDFGTERRVALLTHGAAGEDARRTAALLLVVKLSLSNKLVLIEMC
jgi:hypothetical protein